MARECGGRDAEMARRRDEHGVGRDQECVLGREAVGRQGHVLGRATRGGGGGDADGRRRAVHGRRRTGEEVHRDADGKRVLATIAYRACHMAETRSTSGPEVPATGRICSGAAAPRSVDRGWLSSATAGNPRLTPGPRPRRLAARPLGRWTFAVRRSLREGDANCKVVGMRRRVLRPGKVVVRLDVSALHNDLVSGCRRCALLGRSDPARSHPETPSTGRSYRSVDG